MPERKVKLAPSILSADFARLGQQVEDAVKAGADYIHVDVMDGQFVPNLTVGPLVVEALRRKFSVPLDVHLMIVEPEALIPSFAKAGASIITVHAEACAHLHRVVQQIKDVGARAGVAVNPATPLTAIEEILPYVDLVLVMTVNPGFAGQKFIPSAVGKVQRLRSMLQDCNYSAEVEVDGGINAQTVPVVVQAGANVLVAGAAIFNDKETVAQAIERLRKAV